MVRLTILHILQRAQLRIHLKDDTSSLAAISTVGPSFRDVLLAPEAYAPVPAVTGRHLNLRVVDEHDN